MGRVLSRTICIVWGFWSSAQVSAKISAIFLYLFCLKLLRFKFPASGNAFQSWITFFAWNCAAGRGGGSSWFSCLGVPWRPISTPSGIPLKCLTLSGVPWRSRIMCQKRTTNTYNSQKLKHEMCMNSVNNSSQCHAVCLQYLEHLWFLILPRAS